MGGGRGAGSDGFESDGPKGWGYEALTDGLKLRVSRAGAVRESAPVVNGSW
jgi:hypothetical protein